MTTKSKMQLGLLPYNCYNRHLCMDWMIYLLIDYAFNRYLQFIITCVCHTAVMRRAHGTIPYAMQLQYRWYTIIRTAPGHLSSSRARRRLCLIGYIQYERWPGNNHPSFPTKIGRTPSRT